MATSFKDIERNLYGDLTKTAGPARQSAYDFYGNILKAQPGAWGQMAGPEFDAISKQYDVARRNIINSSPAFGGILGRNLAQNESDKAYGIGQILGGLRPKAAEALSNMSNQDYETGLRALGLAQTQEMADAARKQDMLKSIGGGIVDFLKSGALKGVFTKHAAGVAPGVASAATSGMFTASPLTAGVGTQSIIGPTSSSALTGSSGGVGGFVHGIGSNISHGLSTAAHGVGSGLHSLYGFAASNPFAAAAIGAGIGGAILIKHFVGQGRRAANELTGEGGMQHAFEETLKEIEHAYPNPNDPRRIKANKEAYDQLVKLGLEHAKKGDNERKVVSQMFNTISPLFGLPNPMLTA